MILFFCDNMEKIYIIDINKETNINIENKMYLNHINKYKNKKAYNTSKIAWYYLDRYLLNDFNININNYELLFNEYGKPYINANIHFNISHSFDLIAIIISNNNCAIDIELIKDKDYSRIAKKILTNDEMIEYEKTINKNEYIIKKWTMIECIAKLNGKGINFNNLYERKKVTSKIIKNNNNKYYLSYIIDNE